MTKKIEPAYSVGNGLEVTGQAPFKTTPAKSLAEEVGQTVTATRCFKWIDRPQISYSPLKPARTLRRLPTMPQLEQQPFPECDRVFD
jgi:hypothetical protein